MDTVKLLNDLQALGCVHWDRYVRLFPEMRRTEMPVIKLNNRFVTMAGRCLVEENIVEMGTKLFRFPENYDMLMHDTLPHELAHQVDYNINGLPKGNRWHGPTWQNIMRRFGLEPTTYHNLRTK